MAPRTLEISFAMKKAGSHMGPFEAYADLYYSKSEMPFRWGGPFTGFPVNFGYTATVENNPYWSQPGVCLIDLKYGVLLFLSESNIETITAMELLIHFAFLFLHDPRDIGPTENDRSFESVQFELGVIGEISNNWWRPRSKKPTTFVSDATTSSVLGIAIGFGGQMMDRIYYLPEGWVCNVSSCNNLGNTEGF